MAGAALLALVTAGGGQAFASPGCDAVNAGGFNITVTHPPLSSAGGLTVSNFAIGDAISFTLTATGAVLQIWTLNSGNSTPLDTANTFGGSQVRSYTVTGNNQDTTLTSGFFGSSSSAGSHSVSATCTPAPTTTDSAKLRALQIGVSKLVAETSGAAITGAVNSAIGNALNGGGNPIIVGPNGISFNFTADAPAPRSEVEQRTGEAFAALGYAAMPVKAPPLAPVMRTWSVWAEIRGTGWDRNDANNDLRGNQLNVTAGIGRRVSPNLVIGVLAGFEHFKYDVTSLTGTMKGDGGTIGGYAGWKLAPHLRWDAIVAWSHISYDARAGTAAGSFDGSRVLLSTGLTGQYNWMAVILEPSARIYAVGA